MTQILDRLRAYGEFEVVIIGNDIILDDSVSISDWPICDCLICFASSGFPLEKAIRYVKLRNPFCINDLPSQFALCSRKVVYDILEKFKIPTPRHHYIIRDEAALPVVPAAYASSLLNTLGVTSIAAQQQHFQQQHATAFSAATAAYGPIASLATSLATSQAAKAAKRASEAAEEAENAARALSEAKEKLTKQKEGSSNENGVVDGDNFNADLSTSIIGPATTPPTPSSSSSSSWLSNQATTPMNGPQSPSSKAPLTSAQSLIDRAKIAADAAGVAMDAARIAEEAAGSAQRIST